MGQQTLKRSKIKFLDGVKLSPKQSKFDKLIKDKVITVCTGPAGSSKTFSACYTALKLLGRDNLDKIIITKPIDIITY